jgi:outer membrane lipoprotein-sorting protein
MISSLVASTLLLTMAQGNGSALLTKHEQALREAQSLKVTFTVQHLPAAPQEVTLTFSRPGFIRIETPSGLRITDGKTIWEYDKQSNTYTEFEGTLEDAMDWLKADDVYAWSAFFLKDQFSKVTNVKTGNARTILGHKVIPVEFVLDAKSSKTATLFLDEQLGVARGASIKAARAGDASELVVLAREITLSKDPLPASEFQFVEPAGAKKVEVSAKDAGKWYTDLDEAMKVAKATNRLVFVDVGTEW